MASEITVEVTGDRPVADLQTVLRSMGIGEGSLTRLAVTMEFANGPAEDETDVAGTATVSADGETPGDVDDHERIREGTNQHIALSMLATYLERTDADGATRDDVAQLEENHLSVQQTGNALSLLHRGKELIDADKSEREDGGGYVNTYRLTDAARAELQRVGRYRPFED